MSDYPLCGECKYFKQDRFTDDYAMCTHDRQKKFDVVSGWQPGFLRSVFEYRESGACGMDAKFWEPKE